MSKRQAEAKSQPVARIRSGLACVAGCATFALALGAAPASAQAGSDAESVEEKYIEAFLRELASELDSNVRVQELLEVLSDAGEEERFTESGDDDSSGKWTFDAPMSGSQFEDVVIDFAELPAGWEAAPHLLEEAYSGATPEELSDLHINSEGVALMGPESDAALSKSFTLDGLGVSPTCHDAVQAFDAIDEDVDHMAMLPLAVDGSYAYMFLASTPEEHDLFTGYYDAIVQDCGTSIGEKPVLHVDIEPYESIDGFAVNLTSVGDAEEVHMGGASFGHNHVFFVGEGAMDSGEVQDIVSAQIDALDAAVN